MKKIFFLLLLFLQSTIQSDEFDLSFEERDSLEENKSFEELLDNLKPGSNEEKPRIFGGREARARKYF